ncbi:MAG: hypothetical protein IKE01_02960 [Clostridia bacterium]|nr:hypothetical protein [Clostridia bacterium]
MENCGCKKSNLTACEFIGVILSLVAGVAVGILFAFGFIPIALNFITIALVFSVVTIGILIFSLFTANVVKGNNAFYKCACKYAKLLLAGSIGTFLSTTISAIIGVTVFTIPATIFVALAAFFFVMMITALICLISCIIDKTCNSCDE